MALSPVPAPYSTPAPAPVGTPAPAPGSALVCNYCGCPRRVDPGCPPQAAACASGCPLSQTPGSAPSEPEPRVLDWINRILPNCSANRDYAQWAINNDIFRPVPRNLPCPDGYSYAYSYDNHMLCVNTARRLEAPPEPLASSIKRCASSPAPGQAPAPSPSEDSKFPAWAIVLIVVLVVLLLGGVWFMMSRPPPLQQAPAPPKNF